jgi:hypothetical protein
VPRRLMPYDHAPRAARGTYDAVGVQVIVVA